MERVMLEVVTRENKHLYGDAIEQMRIHIGGEAEAEDLLDSLAERARNPEREFEGRRVVTRLDGKDGLARGARRIRQLLLRQPGRSPPSGPRSIIQSAVLITSR